MTDIRKTFGFKMTDRLTGADYNHCKLIIIELAKLHAISWAYKQKRGIKRLTDIYSNMLDEMFIGKGAEQFRPMIIDRIETSLKVIEKGLGSDSPAYLGATRLRTVDATVELANFLSKDGPDEEMFENLLRIKPELDPNYNPG